MGVNVTEMLVGSECENRNRKVEEEDMREGRVKQVE